MNEEIIDSIIATLEKKLKLNNLNFMMDYLIINYYYSYYKNNFFLMEKSKRKLKQFLKEYNFQKQSISAFYGNTMLLYIIDAYDNENDLLEYKEEIVNYVISYSRKLVELDYKIHIDLCHEAYDLIHGLSGILLYFVNSIDIEKNKDFICELIDWFFSRLKEDEINLTGFLIKKMYILDTKTREFISNGQGYIDMGLSHGIIAIAIALSKAYKLGIKKKKSYEGVNIILNFYRKYVNTNNSALFPEIVAINNNYSIPHYELRVSWCYGSLGILRGLHIISENINNNALKYEIFSLIERLYSIDINFYMLSYPTFCHGYSGLFYISHLFEMERKNILFECKIEESFKIIWEMTSKKNVYYFYDKNMDYYSETEEIKSTDILEGIASILVPYFIVFSKKPIKNDFFSKLLAIV